MNLKRINLKRINVLNDAQENTNIEVNEMSKTVQNLNTRSNKDIEILRRTCAEMKMD